MELKRIIARDSRRATEKAIQQYGKDVLVISTQLVDDHVELIVAVDVARMARAEPAEFRPVLPTALPPGDPFRQPAATAREMPVAALAALAAAREASTAPAAAEALAAFPAAPQALSPAVASAASQLAPQLAPQSASPVVSPAAPLASAQAAGFAAVFAGALKAEGSAAKGGAVMADPAASTAGDAADDVSAAISSSAEEAYEMQRSREIVSLLCKEVAALRQEFSLTRKYGAWQSQPGLHPAVAPIAEHLQDCGVPASLHALLMDTLHGCESVPEALAGMRKLLVDALANVPQTSPALGVHALCGPSGAGKTTMVARLAARAAERLGAESQAIVSFQDSRPGAWAQLQMLAAQAGVDCFRAPNEESLHLLLDELATRKNVWIDTSGVDFMATPRLFAGNDQGNGLHKVSLHLVLPFDATFTNVRKVFDVPNSLWSSLMLSKSDESAHPWALIQALCDKPMAVSAVVDSDRVAAPLAPFAAARLVDVALAPVRAALEVPETAAAAALESAANSSTWAALRAALGAESQAHV